MRYGGKLTFALLSLIFPFVNLQDQFHVDHIFPDSCFSQRCLSAVNIPDDKILVLRRRKDRLPNLQLLQGSKNNEKSDTMPADWLIDTYTDDATRRAYEERHMLGSVPESISDFDAFYNARRERLKTTISQILGR